MRTLWSRLLAGLVALSIGVAAALVSVPAVAAQSPDAAPTVDAAGAPSEVTSWAVAVLAAGVFGALSNRGRRRG